LTVANSGFGGLYFFFKELLGTIRSYFYEFIPPMDYSKSFGPILAS